MKKISSVLMALALVLGLSQCRKPENPGLEPGGGEGQLKTIQFTVNDNGGAKGDLVYANQKLRYQWDNNDNDDVKDSLYVYYSTQSGASFNGTYIGSIPVTQVTVVDGSYIAKFSGELTLPTTAGYLRFIHFGQGITVNKTGSASVDFSLQNGDISSVSSKIVAVAPDQAYDGSQATFNGAMPVKFAIMKLDLSGFGADNVLLNGADIHNTINVSSTGSISYSGTGTVLGNVTSNPTAYYAVVPTGHESATSTLMTFEGNDKIATGTKEIKDNGYYHGPDGDASIIVNATSYGGGSSNGAGSAESFGGGNW